jgi:uncharacterized protein (TIGR02145 family)
MKYLFGISFIIILIILTISCKEDKPTPPIIITTSVTEMSYTTATCGGEATNEGGASIISKGICWNTSANPTISSNKTTETGGLGSFSSNLTQLSVNTLYYVRAYATNSAGTGYGNQVKFTTRQIAVPDVTTTEITSITPSSAISGGNVTSDNGDAVSSRGVCWSTTINPTTNDNKTTDGSGIGTFSSSFNALTGITLYYVRAYAINGAGIGYGNQVSFTTLSDFPTVTTTPITSITSTSCESGGTVISDGGHPVIKYGVCWSLLPNPGQSVRSTADGTGIGSFSSFVTSLSPNTTYYLQAYAANEIGVGYGNVTSFTTTTSPIIFNNKLTYGSVTDVEGNVYKTITIGSRVWMAENLKTTMYQNGDLLGTTLPTDKDIQEENSPGYQWVYENVESNLSLYGRLYTWYVATDSRNICPVGWHVSTNSDWYALTDLLGGSSLAGAKTKEASFLHWIDPNTGATNESGYTALPSGYRYPFGIFSGSGMNAAFWAPDPIAPLLGVSWVIEENKTSIMLTPVTKGYGYSIRCVKD